ncbi:peptide chain release factor N(5)-glutamine methyltransferase [Microbulbifer thermotolerans]|uniref:peptide chain release factor N(5)-glutamine methyltransferase n=1 Tax=Microbulbifer thermotolerans TaxID=252514 RepID=UPI002248C4D2|nr:peptide chain release factor N(5)-glutamine methyltransferase [Microbulbifer thermotolerans]MCX2780572.1 peptide chain release factor N(5)-glutamine methyltransferase [Microbulbifer thermotolerans]MCX2794267.1 peptide chain release factor N(5)-glutamine methyltransferase [Microbulbifer thermotolerans]MCX2803498.1 peptide chain release factor N(5)-glutamine methyltransferase [Microbulbifer thermotolerans]MCX2830028.1 peptide chain release factor N(5)-glutamine methyltransferase [Microbulbifer
MSTVKETLSRCRELADSDSARLDTEVLLGYVLGRPRTWLYTWPEYQLTPSEQRQFERLFERRKKGEPVAYLTGEREFWSLSLKVNASTLIPRPETELLVEIALQLCPQTQLRALDLGTGSGAIALALAAEKPGWTIVAAEKSADALALAQENRKALGFGNVELVQSDWFAEIPQREFDLIVSNPPYIDAADPHLSEGDVRFEPRSALVAEGEGLADIAAIARHSGEYLKPGGWLMVEHGWQQAAAVRELFADAGLHGVESRKDYSGWERVTLGRK